MEAMVNDGPGSMVGGELLIIYSNTNLNMQSRDGGKSRKLNIFVIYI